MYWLWWHFFVCCCCRFALFQMDGAAPNLRGLFNKVYLDFIQRKETHFNEVFVQEVDNSSLRLLVTRVIQNDTALILNLRYYNRC